MHIQNAVNCIKLHFIQLLLMGKIFEWWNFKLVKKYYTNENLNYGALFLIPK